MPQGVEVEFFPLMVRDGQEVAFLSLRAGIGTCFTSSSQCLRASARSPRSMSAMLPFIRQRRTRSP